MESKLFYMILLVLVFYLSGCSSQKTDIGKLYPQAIASRITQVTNYDYLIIESNTLFRVEAQITEERLIKRTAIKK